jgi:hypothetical protein
MMAQEYHETGGADQPPSRVSAPAHGRERHGRVHNGLVVRYDARPQRQAFL